ncbi:hypothetical protein IMCC26134_14795 [Verrucomicrobia bacterium IMCC26134]|nr:hypothetical protein IMCC26134_14795 [Verrucomicrobia bacterium IMCC26134]
MSLILKETNGRTLAFAIIALWMAGFATALISLGSNKAVALIIAQPMGRTYADLRLFPSSRQEFANGGNPCLTNPSDHWGRTYNYPGLWLSFMRFPESSVPLLGTTLIVLWLAGLGTWWGVLTLRQGLAGGLLACSPPVILALERGNTDLIIFLFLLIALYALGRRKLIWSGLIIIGAFVLKLYPVVALFSFMRLGWSRAIPRLALGLATCALYFFIFREELSQALGNTPKSVLTSYGSTIWIQAITYLANESSDKIYSATPLLIHVKLAAAFLVLAAFALGWRKSNTVATPPPDRHLEGFWLGAIIFAATFIIGANFDYRLIFLLLCVPWLWRRDPSGSPDTRRVKTTASAMLFGCLWINPHWWFPFIHLRESCTWILLISLGWLLGNTCPCLPQQWKCQNRLLHLRLPKFETDTNIPR